MVRLRISLREHHEGAGDAAVSYELLGPVQHVLVAVPLGARLHRGGVGSAARLRQRVGRDLLTRGERRTQSPLLLLCAGDEDRIAAQRLHRQDQGGGGAGFGDLLDAHADGDARARDASVFLWERDAEDAVGREQRLDVLRILGALIDLGRARRDSVLDELANGFPDRELLLRELEVHVRADYRSKSRAMTRRWIWFEPS